MSNVPSLLDYQTLFKTLPGLYIVVLPDFEVAAVTDEYLDATMVKREDLIGRNLFDVFPENPDDGDTHGANNVKTSLERVFQTGKIDVLPIQKYDLRRPAENGGGYEERYWKIGTIPAFDAAGNIPCVIHYVEDITDQIKFQRKEVEQEKANADLKIEATQIESKRKKAEDALKDVRLRLKFALEAGEIGTWTWDIINDRVVADDNLAKFFSISKKDAAGGKIEKYIAAIHPEDAGRVGKLIDEVIKNGEFYETEYRLINPDETIRLVVARGRVLRDEEGQPIQLPGVVIDVTGRKRSEEELRESQKRLALALQAGRAGTFVWDIKNNVNIWSPELEELYGVPVGTFEGNLEAWSKRVVPKDAEAVTELIQTALKQGDEYLDYEFRAILPDDSPRWFAGRARFEYDAENQPLQMFGINIDITASKRVQELLLERTTLATLIGDIGVALNRREDLPSLLKYCTDALVEHLDVAFARVWMLDKTGETLELQASSGLYTHLDGAHSRVRVGQFKIGKIAEQRQPHLTNDVAADPLVSDREWANHEKMVSFVGYPLIVEDKLVGVLCAFSRQPLTEAITQSMAAVSNTIANAVERKNVEEERQNLLVNEQELRRGAEEANRIKDEFLATLSHELRTPLSSILGWSRMIKEGQLTGEQTQRAIETIERNAKLQAQLIEDVLDVSRIISGKMRLEVEPVDFSVIIEEAIDAVRPAAEAKNIRLQRVTDSHVMIAGDADRLQQIVWNLLSNSIKFTPKGGRVQVKMERINSHVEITVADNGIGIEPDTLPYIFERFRQSDSSTTRSHGGLGLGLAIVRHLVELHGGTVQAASDGLNQGSVFTLAFPLIAVRSKIVPLKMEIEDAENVYQPVADEGALICPPEVKGLRILLVDDEPDTREMLMFIFETCEAHPTGVASAAAALDAIKAGKFDVLVSDIGMPERDGYDLIKSVRELFPEQGGQIPAVALTAYARVEDRLRVLSAGFQMHVPKPVEPAELLAVVASLAKRNVRK